MICVSAGIDAGAHQGGPISRGTSHAIGALVRDPERLQADVAPGGRDAQVCAIAAIVPEMTIR